MANPDLGGKLGETNRFACADSSHQQQWPHGGNLREMARLADLAEDDLLDFSANINPLGPPEWLRQVISANVSRLAHYPDPQCTALIAAAAAHYQLANETLLAGNGSVELLYALLPVLKAERALILTPGYHDYFAAAESAGIAVQSVAHDLAALEQALEPDARPTVVILGRPNNPTGSYCDGQRLRLLMKRFPRCWFVIDEAFADFIAQEDRFVFDRPANAIVLLSATKSYAVPGLRLGLMAAGASVVEQVRRALPPWTVNTLAQAVGAAAFNDKDYLERSRKMVREWRATLAARLAELPGLQIYPGEANFLLIRLLHVDWSARELAERLLQRGIAIRVCDNFEGLEPNHFRVAVRTGEENERLLSALQMELCGTFRVGRKRRTPALMFQGTCSNAGKSVLTAAFCRILWQDGFRVAPFKAQNMSLNSFVTHDGLELGRAQALQAQACHIDPDVRMNPVLLKPNSDTGSQVILRGLPVGNYNAKGYFGNRERAWAIARECYNSLSAESEVMVLEGAGSPAEVNLKHNDIVNMAMAMHAEAPVVLVGDIDRGGVFAALIGCMETFTERERSMVAGFVLNRFRGDKNLLGDAVQYVLRHTGVPVLGVVPYLRDLRLPEEDSVVLESGLFQPSPLLEACVDVAVIALPHMANFTDLDALRIEPDVRLRFVRTAEELGAPDAVILPGSKNVPGDLQFLAQQGIAAAITDLARKRASQIVGICGGFQMLGMCVNDPYHIEWAGGTAEGLGLLPVSTTLEQQKTLRRACGRHLASGLRVCGYEIHHGQTRCADPAPVLRDEDGAICGHGSEDGKIWGTYWHGIFDQDEFRRWFVDGLRSARMQPLGRVVARYDIEPALDRLAEAFREAIPVEELYRRMGLR